MTMTQILRLFVAAIGCCTGCSKSNVMTPLEFSREFADAMRQSHPSSSVVIVNDLELKVKSPDGRSSTAFLNNAYDLYRQDPKAMAEVIQKFITSSLETINNPRDGADRERIVPVIKDRPWLTETRQALRSRGVEKIPQHVYEDFSPELIVLYAEDSPKNIRYLEPTDLDLAKIDRAELRKLACDNLKRLLPKIESHGTNGFYMLTAGGDYEASLLLLDSIWNGAQIKVDGDFVVAIPTRDLLLVTGSRNSQGIAKLKQMAREALSRGAYRLTEKLFVYRDGKFSEFNEDAGSKGATNGDRTPSQ